MDHGFGKAPVLGRSGKVHFSRSREQSPSLAALLSVLTLMTLTHCRAHDARLITAMEESGES